jgi:hypothetical protein
MKDRRKRFSRPTSILCIGILLCALPCVNSFLILNELGLGKYSFAVILKSLTLIQLALLMSPLPIGIGLLMIRKWAWWAILLYFPTLIIYDLSILLSTNSVFNIGVLARTVLGFGLIVFFLRKDISAPYFKLYPRGWRGEKRKPVELDVIIDDRKYKTKDVSSNGVYVDWKDCDKELGDEIIIRFKQVDNNSLPKEAKVGIVRIDEVGVGLAFRK